MTQLAINTGVCHYENRPGHAPPPEGLQFTGAPIGVPTLNTLSLCCARVGGRAESDEELLSVPWQYVR